MIQDHALVINLYRAALILNLRIKEIFPYLELKEQSESLINIVSYTDGMFEQHKIEITLNEELKEQLTNNMITILRKHAK